MLHIFGVIEHYFSWIWNYNDIEYMMFECLIFRMYDAEYEKKIDECQQKTEKAKSEAPLDSEIELLQKELEAELEMERLYKEELR